MIKNFDPINNRDDFIAAIKSVYRWSRFVDIDQYTKKMGKKQNVDSDIAKMDICENAIVSYITQWDACSTEQERAALVGGIRSPVI